MDTITNILYFIPIIGIVGRTNKAEYNKYKQLENIDESNENPKFVINIFENPAFKEDHHRIYKIGNDDAGYYRIEYTEQRGYCPSDDIKMR